MLLQDFKQTYLRINKADGYILDAVYAKEGDQNGRELLIQIINDGVVQNLTGISVNLGWKHTKVGNQGLDPFTEVDATKGLFKITYPIEMLNKGNVIATIQVVDGSSIVNTKNFTINVDENPYTEEAVILSDSYSVFQKAIEKANSWNLDYEEIKSDLIDEVDQFVAAENQRIIDEIDNLIAEKEILINQKVDLIEQYRVNAEDSELSITNFVDTLISTKVAEIDNMISTKQTALDNLEQTFSSIVPILEQEYAPRLTDVEGSLSGMQGQLDILNNKDYKSFAIGPEPPEEGIWFRDIRALDEIEIIEPLKLHLQDSADNIILGDEQLGFYGEVTSEKFVTGAELKSLAGLEEGVLVNSDTDWIKFSFLGEIVYFPKNNLMHSISWNTLNAAGCIYGEKEVEVKGGMYKVRVLNSDEFDALIRPIHIAYNSLKTGYTSEDLDMREKSQLILLTELNETSARVFLHLHMPYSTAPKTQNQNVFFRPVLELIQ